MNLSQVVPARASSARDLPALETVMQGLVLDQRSPIALEIAATSTERAFVLRAHHPVALRHLERQIQARYPQAVIRPAKQDLLPCEVGEECTVVELLGGATPDLPLRSLKPRDLLAEGVDPLLGILAACSDLPVGTRVVTQLALVPLAPTWSSSMRRRAVEHPLEQERTRERRAASSNMPGLGQVAVLFVLVSVLTVIYFFHRQLSRVVPTWLSQAFFALLRGQAPQLTLGQILQLGFGLLVILFAVFAALVGGSMLANRFGHTPIYAQRLIEEKTARPAYRVRLRLFVFMAAAQEPRYPASLHLAFQELGMILPTLRHVSWSLRWARLKEWGSVTWSQQRIWWHDCWQQLLARRARSLERMDRLRMLTAAYAQYHLAAGGYFRPQRLSAWSTRALLRPSSRLWQGWRRGLTRSPHILSVADLAMLWHLPQAQDLAELGYLEWRTMRTLLAPSMLSQGQGYRLGSSTHAGQTLPVFLPFSCLSQNLLAVASTGKGKSTLFAHLMEAFARGRLLQVPGVPDGALLIDPHGDLARQVVSALPPTLVDAIVWINLADRDYPIAFNPLDMSGGADRDQRIDHLIQVIEPLWSNAYGMRTENFVEYTCKTLAEANATLIARDAVNGPDQQYTLLDVVTLLRKRSFRNAVLELVSDPNLHAWWHQYYDLLDEKQQADFTSSLITKMSKFASSRLVSRILGQPRSTLDLGELIRQDKIVIFSCASGEIGADMAALFGSLFVGFFQTALQEQARVAPIERHRFLVLIDEFQLLSGIDYQSMLAELRKYGGSFALATQSLAYLDRFERQLRATVLANMEHVFAFAMADADARLLHLPGIEPEDIAHLPSYACYARLSLQGARLPVFSLHLDLPPQGNFVQAEESAERTRARYGRPIGEVVRMLQECQIRRGGLGQARETEKEAELFNGKKRKRGSGTTKKAENGSQGTPPEHVLYEDLEEELPPWKPEDTEEGGTQR